jgi:hypothetical protein
MGSWGTPGESAQEGYRSAVRERRRWGALRLAVIGGAPVAGWVAYGAASGRTRLEVEGVLAVCFLVAVAWRPDSDTRRWLRGSAGEVATASALDRLPPKKWEIFHDLAVPGSRSNIDHLAIGPTGVWVVDSKTTRAPVRVGMFSVRLGDRRLDCEPVRWQAGIVGERLGVRARPLIALHCPGGLYGSSGSGGSGGSGVHPLPRRGVRRGGVRIMLAGDVTRRLKRGRRRFRRGDVQAAAGEVMAHFRPAAASRENWSRD